MSLYLDYRPTTFDDVIGQTQRAELASLEGLLGRKKHPHSFLFIGASGCGKTTTARICAEKLGATGEDIIEINSSSTRGIDTARQIISNMRHAPLHGDAIIYIIDEVHQASKDWQNAMLKPLEDTPPHVYFFLCTTDPQKLIPTLKSRCAKFEFPALTYKETLKLVKRVDKAEGLKTSMDVMEVIAEMAKGNARSSLVLLEKTIGLDEDAAIEAVEGFTDEENAEAIDLCRALIDKHGSWGEISKILNKLRSGNIEQIRHAVLGYMSAIILKKKNPMSDRCAMIMEYFQEPFYVNGFKGLVLACYQSMGG